MANEIEITARGWVATEPTLSITPSGMRVVKMRVGSTPRWRDPITGGWGDGPTQWFTVVAFRELAVNAGHSLHKGMPVLVRGRLEFQAWEHEGKRYSENRIIADSIGPDLGHGTALYVKMARGGGAPQVVVPEAGVRGPASAEPGPDRDGFDVPEPVDLSEFEVLDPDDAGGPAGGSADEARADVEHAAEAEVVAAPA